MVDESGQPLWQRSARTRRPVASATKMVTALVTVAGADLADDVEVSARAAAVPGGRFSLEEGEVFTVRELLFALLVGSSNDAAVALAEHVAGGEPAFVRRMNETATELGAARSTFTTPHGLDDPGHLSTAADLALIGAAVVDHPVLAGIVSTTRVELSSSRRTATVENTNELLDRYEGLVGIKTGFTAQAGNVLVAAAERHGRRVIAVAMSSDNAFRDARRLLDHGFRILAAGVLLEAGEPVGSIVFDPGGAVRVAAGAEVRGLPPRTAVDLRLRVSDDVRAPLAPGEPVGTVVLTMDGQVIGRTRAVATSTLTGEPPGWTQQAIASLIRIAALALPGVAA